MKQSAGILLYRKKAAVYEVLLVHPGGPFWAKKDEHAWSLPKGEFDDDVQPIEAARREFQEETGIEVPKTTYTDLGTARYGNKLVYAWAVEGDMDETQLTSNMIEIDWPPRSGKKMEIPEVDRAAWCSLRIARQRLVKGQLPLLERWAEIFSVTDVDTELPTEQATLF